MSAEWVRRAYEAFAQRDWSQLSELLDPAIDFRTTVEAASGYAGVEDWIRQADDLFEGFEIRVEDVIEAGDRVMGSFVDRDEALAAAGVT
jgi:ketosteroid isomerase-like protein